MHRAHGDWCRRDQAFVRQFALQIEVAAQAAGAHGEHNVIDRGAIGQTANGFEILQRKAPRFEHAGGETSLLKRVMGNSCGRPRNSPAKVLAADFTVVQLRVSGCAMRKGKVATLKPARSSRPRLPGAVSGNQGAGGAGGGESAETSCSKVVISLPRATSIAA
jgi:hypothetical protein